MTCAECDGLLVEPTFITKAGVKICFWCAKRRREKTMHGHGDGEPCGLNCPVGGADGARHSVTVEGVTLCTDEPFTAGEQAALGAYFRMLRADRDRRFGVKDLDGNA